MPLGHDHGIAPVQTRGRYATLNFKRIGVAACVMFAAILAGCTSSGNRAPVSDLNSSQSAAAVGKTYTVKAGDTLSKIARANGVDEGALIRLNKLSNPNRLEVGQVLRLNDSADTSSGVKPVVSKKPEARPLDTESAQPPARASDAGVISWGWPAKGNVVQPFTTASKGIDIAGNAGDPIQAAANGKVVYSGNGLRGYGNLIILDHGNGFVTAYAHNRTLSVKKDQDVKKGTKIAEMGQTDSTTVKLHFEIRRQGTPVDPMQYLPAK
ncbi:peptidoglycan DD-metalloendopeptidase family protein [Orrella sp. NBD-18]|uniref:Peptidoglycan DD-metalloendopeptidase family protein n=2 Tax=Sheuella amnicola TaxID=2707330 RepID=A0A6B2QWI0_9BURK|nr:peptidoglycan DD-metalloendopeptidase family protein [Sheuella amnicola]NDY81998.1 peptidoglycan DD-metalloendopeptidase family protein [Sheuella amnicola]